MSARQDFQRGVHHTLTGMARLGFGNLPALAGAIAGAALAAGVTVAIWPGAPTQAATDPAGQFSATAAVSTGPLACADQTWPFLSADCVKGGVGDVRQVRVVSRDPSVPHSIPGRAARVEERGTTARATVTAPPASQVAAMPPQAPSTPPVAADPPQPRYSAATVRDGRHLTRQMVRQKLRAARRAAGSYDVSAGRPLAIHPTPQDDRGARRALAYGDEERPRVVIVPFERNFGVR